MTTLHKLTLTAAGLSLAAVATWPTAQTPPPKPGVKAVGKTLGGKTAGSGKLMTREELRSCLKRLDEANLGAKEITAQRQLLDRERDELKVSGGALAAERAVLDRQLAAVREWESRMRAYAVEVETFNQRSRAAQEAPRGQQDKLATDLKADRERLESLRQTLSADEARLVPTYQANAKAYNERAIARDNQVTDWNARNAAAVDASVNQQEVRALWLNECANRPYLEDDEKAVRAGN